jgi:hypothetical protein
MTIEEHMIEIKYAFGYQNKKEYDYRLGVSFKTTDRQDHNTIYVLEAKRRFINIKSPC